MTRESCHQPTNQLGYIGFVASLCSFATCGYLSPLALLVCLIALRQFPYGFAIAGAAIATVQLVVVLWFGVTPMWAIVCVGVAGAAALVAGKKQFSG